MNNTVQASRDSDDFYTERKYRANGEFQCVELSEHRAFASVFRPGQKLV